MKLIVRHLPCTDYFLTLEKMQSHTAKARAETPDELWLCEHFPVYTQGKHQPLVPVHNPWNIPTLASDRGGKITYHGPGQCIVYFLVDLKRLKQGVKGFVHTIEQRVIDLLGHYEIQAERRLKAPGIYVDQAKIASLGLRIKNGRTYHGLSLNVTMDLSPFEYIDPCGYADLKMVNMVDYLPHITLDEVKAQFAERYATSFQYTDTEVIHEVKP